MKVYLDGKLIKVLNDESTEKEAYDLLIKEGFPANVVVCEYHWDKPPCDEQLATIKGLKVTDIDYDDDTMEITVDDGRRFQFYHEQDCCEYVRIYGGSDKLHCLKGMVLKDVDVNIIDDYDEHIDEYSDSHTWTNFKFVTDKDTVIVRWLGESNGYYGEGVDIEQFLVDTTK